MNAATIPVSIRIGKQSWVAGSLPDQGLLPDEIMQPLVKDLIAEVRSRVARASESLRLRQDVLRITSDHYDAFEQAIADHPTQASGPMARILREEAGVTVAEMAKHLRRNPQTVRRWEAGEEAKSFSLLDDWRASEALGFHHGAITGAYLAMTIPDADLSEAAHIR